MSPASRPIEDRAAEKFDVRDAGYFTPCWIWTAALFVDGRYGQLWDEAAGKTRVAHRVLYERFVEPIAEGLELDHLCRNRACVNPDHLEPVTRRENGLRGDSPAGRGARATACPQGHPYEEGNLKSRRDGSRECLTCHRARERRRYARQVASGDGQGFAS